MGLSNQSGQPYDPVRVAAVVDASLHNTAREHIRGIDLAVDYGAQLGVDSRITLAGSATYLDAKRQSAANLPYEGRSGLIFTPPKFRARSSVGWESAAVQFSASLNYLDSTLDNRLPITARIGAFTTVDMSGSYRTGKGHGLLADLEFRLNLQNLLNEAPDLIRTSDPTWVPFDSTNQSAIGRFVSLSVTKQW